MYAIKNFVGSYVEERTIGEVRTVTKFMKLEMFMGSCEHYSLKVDNLRLCVNVLLTVLERGLRLNWR